MATEFGKILRKVRIDHDEYLKNMADKLEVSSAFLSAIENGTKIPPTNFIGKIAEAYHLSEETITTLRESLNEYRKTVKIDVSNANKERRDLAVSFARKFDSFDKETLAEFITLLNKSEGRA